MKDGTALKRMCPISPFVSISRKTGQNDCNIVCWVLKFQINQASFCRFYEFIKLTRLCKIWTSVNWINWKNVTHENVLYFFSISIDFKQQNTKTNQIQKQSSFKNTRNPKNAEIMYIPENPSGVWRGLNHMGLLTWWVECILSFVSRLRIFVLLLHLAFLFLVSLLPCPYPPPRLPPPPPPPHVNARAKTPWFDGFAFCTQKKFRKHEKCFKLIKNILSALLKDDHTEWN